MNKSMTVCTPKQTYHNSMLRYKKYPRNIMHIAAYGLGTWTCGGPRICAHVSKHMDPHTSCYPRSMAYSKTAKYLGSSMCNMYPCMYTVHYLVCKTAKTA